MVPDLFCYCCMSAIDNSKLAQDAGTSLCDFCIGAYEVSWSVLATKNLCFFFAHCMYRAGYDSSCMKCGFFFQTFQSWNSIQTANWTHVKDDIRCWLMLGGIYVQPLEPQLILKCCTTAIRSTKDITYSNAWTQLVIIVQGFTLFEGGWEGSRSAQHWSYVAHFWCSTLVARNRVFCKKKKRCGSLWGTRQTATWEQKKYDTLVYGWCSVPSHCCRFKSHFFTDNDPIGKRVISQVLRTAVVQHLTM